MQKKTALITGASSGIGRATAHKLALSGYRLLLTGRRQDRLDLLQIELSQITEVHTLCFDIQDRSSVMQTIADLPSDWNSIDVLVNNAGLAAGISSIQNGNMDDWDTMINTNIKGLLYISKAVMPTLIHNKGFIINISSIAGKEVYELGNVYCASKSAVDALSKAMRIDLLNTGVRVCNLSPGRVETEFTLVRLKGNIEQSKKLYAEFEALQPEDIAETIAFVLMSPAHVCISDIIITPTAQATVNKVCIK